MSEILQGQLGPIRLGSLLQLIEHEHLSGWLRLSYPQRVGSVGVRQGQIITAQLGEHQGLAALYELFLENTGQFSVEQSPTHQEVEGAPLGSMLGLMMEAYRRVDEWERLAPRIYAPCTKLPDDPLVRAVLARLDGRRCVAALVQGQLRTPLVDPLLMMVERGELQELGVVSAEELAMPEDFDALMERGRELLRQRKYAEAEAAFQRALVVRPDDRIAQQNLRRTQELQQGASAGASSRAFNWFRGT